MRILSKHVLIYINYESPSNMIDSLECEVHYLEDCHTWEKKKGALGISVLFLIRWWRKLDIGLSGGGKKKPCYTRKKLK